MEAEGEGAAMQREMRTGDKTRKPDGKVKERNAAMGCRRGVEEQEEQAARGLEEHLKHLQCRPRTSPHQPFS